MIKLKDLFKLNIEEEISLVIKTDEQEPSKIEKEIREYIVTNQIEKYLETFLKKYTLNSTEEIGVWISGFFGSGKSYFAKILSYIISNPHLGNLTAHDRFRERLNASDKKDFIDGLMSKTEDIPSEVIMFEIISDSSSNKSDTVQGIMLKRLFKKLGYSKYLNVSSMEFELQEHDLYDEFKNYVLENASNFNEIRNNQGTFRKYATNFLVELKDYSDQQAIDFLKSAVEKYSQTLTPEDFTDICLKISEKYHERIVFIIDEIGAFVTSEKNSDKYLLQLQAISEKFASMGKGKLWLVATSQEKLDQISQIAEKKSVFSKIVDRFAIRFDLTSENVDEVIQRKMLAKKKDAEIILEKLFEDKAGNIQTISDTKGKYSKTDELKNFTSHYPFFDYHFKLLSDLIESPYGAKYAKANERKLISIVDVILKKLKDKDYTTIVNIVDVFDGLGIGFFGSGMVERFKKIDEDLGKSCKNSPFKPSDIMKALEIIKRTDPREPAIRPDEETLTHVLISDLDEDLSEMKGHVRRCVEMLKESKMITEYDGILNIVSNAEREFMDHLEEQVISLPEVKKRIVEGLKNVLNLSFAYKNGPNIPIEFSYNDKRWGKSGGIMVKVLSFETNEESVKELIGNMEFESANHNEIIYLVPAPSEIEEKAGKIESIRKTLEEFQTRDSSELEEVLERYEKIYDEKTRELEKEMKTSLNNGTVVYSLEHYEMNGNVENSLKEIISSHVINQLYSHITSEKAKMEDVKKILTEPKEKLALIRQDDDHMVFDQNGELIEGHKIIVPLMNFLKDSRRGSDVLDTFTKAPYGWTQETVLYTTAALLRSGKVKINKSDDYSDHEMFSILTTSNKFKNAVLSLNSTIISVEQKETLSAFFEKILGEKEVRIEDPNSKFFQIGERVIKRVIDYVEETKKMLNLLGNDKKMNADQLNEIKFKLRNKNPKALETILMKKDEFDRIFSEIREEKEFLQRNVESLKKEKSFVEQVRDEMRKASVEDENLNSLNFLLNEYEKMSHDVFKNRQALEETFEKIRNEYKIIFTPFHEEKESLLNDSRKLLEESSTKKNALEEVAREQGWFSKYEYEIKEPCTGLEIERSPKCENCKLGLYETQLLIPKIKSDLKEFKEKFDEFMHKTPELKGASLEKTKVIKLKKKMTYGELKRKISENPLEDDTVIEIEVEG